ncbi:amidohydrolase family protein [Xylophilus sp.]|uniref:amidohydrolase family protein n=1 Tax=Xylophilus sp. TaxID=2653893 RepID=UPI0013B7B8CD|nr:amidohydrolase family protein [Xylophilus sp.]KAF1050073.1 MAG: 2-pyrone-4,6-dicarbaxylate hydrolase [Xylophilus sp.]
MTFTVPHSAGSAAPQCAVPPLACDAHIHIYDRRFASIGDPARVLDDATAGDYRLLQARLGTQRAVVVTPTVYGTDNTVTLDAIVRLGRERTRGVAVLHPDVDEATLRRLDDGGVRGIRFTLFDPASAVTRFGMVEPLAARIAPLGWHVQLHWRGDQIVEHAALLRRLPCPMVFDHLARLPHPQGPDHPAFGIVAELLAEGRAWIKMSGAYLDPAPAGEPDSRAAVAAAWLREAPDRLVWGSDWPHPTERGRVPDDAALLDRWAARVPHAEVRRRILVDNPARLYGF